MDQYLLESPYSQYDVLTSILAKSHFSFFSVFFDVHVVLLFTPNAAGEQRATGKSARNEKSLRCRPSAPADS